MVGELVYMQTSWVKYWILKRAMNLKGQKKYTRAMYELDRTVNDETWMMLCNIAGVSHVSYEI